MKVSDLFVYQDTTLKQALEIIDQQGLGGCLLLNSDFSFSRTITDGDIRRFLIKGGNLENKLWELGKIDAIWVHEGTPLVDISGLLQKHDIQSIPVLDKNGRPIDMVIRKHLENPILLSYPHLGEFETHFVQQAFDTNWIAPLGPNVENFEKEIAEYVNIKGGLAVSSGTAALHLALDIIGVRAQDIVFCSSFTFVASVNPILYQGAKPVFIDSEPNTWNMSPSALQQAMDTYDQMNQLPKAVIVVNLYGQSADMLKIKAICDAYNVPIIEDAAESLGASYWGKKSGTFGKIGFYSFNGNKIITTSGGGMIVSDDEEIINKARFLSTQAKDRADYYLHTRLGYNYRMSNILAGVGRGQLKVLDERVTARRNIFNLYQKELKDIEAIQWMPEPEGYYSTRWLSCCLINPQVYQGKLEDLYHRITLKGIEVRRLWKPMHTQPLYAGSNFFMHDGVTDFSNFSFDHGLCLPSSSNMTLEQQHRVIDTLKKLLG